MDNKICIKNARAWVSKVSYPKNFRKNIPGKEKKSWKPLKFESSAFAFVCFEISTLLNLEISTLLKLEISSFRRVENFKLQKG